jgi:GNAT superfamily N-acetyltransferase
MAEGEAQGTPFPSPDAGPLDEWSAAIYLALQHWARTKDGEWRRWEPGYLMLTIKRLDGDEIEPVSLCTADDEVTVGFGFWSTHNPEPEEDRDADSDVIAEHARQLAERWLSGDLRTAMLKDAEGKWCGSTLIQPGALEPQLRAAAQWVRDWHPRTIEVRAARRGEWRHFTVAPEWFTEAGPQAS